jgi:hypothetical protein
MFMPHLARILAAQDGYAVGKTQWWHFKKLIDDKIRLFDSGKFPEGPVDSTHA